MHVSLNIGLLVRAILHSNRASRNYDYSPLFSPSSSLLNVITIVLGLRLDVVEPGYNIPCHDPERNENWISTCAREVFKSVFVDGVAHQPFYLSKWTPVAVAHLQTISDPMQVEMNVKNLTGQ